MLNKEEMQNVQSSWSPRTSLSHCSSGAMLCSWLLAMVTLNHHHCCIYVTLGKDKQADKQAADPNACNLFFLSRSGNPKHEHREHIQQMTKDNWNRQSINTHEQRQKETTLTRQMHCGILSPLRKNTKRVRLPHVAARGSIVPGRNNIHNKIL